MKSFLRCALPAGAMPARATAPGGKADQDKHRETIAPIVSLHPAY